MKPGKSEHLKLPMIIVIRPKALEQNFSDQLYNPAKRVGDHMEQCTGDTYDTLDPALYSPEEIERRATKLISKYYADFPLGKFANMVKSIEHDVKLIAHEFSDRVIIVDEVHKLRQGKELKEKKIVEMLMLIVKHAKNVKLILMSATPMFDRAEEIWDLMQLLYLNDRVSFQSDNVLFDGTEMTESAKTKIADFSSRFVSYMRGDNPDTFPIRIYPSAFDYPHVLQKENFPHLQPSGESIPANEELRYTELCHCTMSPWQARAYRQTMANDVADTADENVDEIDESDDIGIIRQFQIANIVFPGNEHDAITNLYGNAGFQRCFEVDRNNRMMTIRYQPDIVEKYGHFLDFDHVAEYSPKIHRLLETLRTSEGVVFIYSRFLNAGIKPLLIALEHEGYRRYGGHRLLEGVATAKTRAYYSVITGDPMLSPDANKKVEIEIAKSSSNINGEKIKLIIGNEAASEGLDFKAIREIHILTPGYNMNLIEQIIGRGVRNMSHVDLPIEKRNVSIYQYCNMLPGPVESIDFRLYRKSEVKQIGISKVERVIKENAVDCVLNKPVLFHVEGPSKDIITSQGKQITYKSGDKPFTKTCDFMECQTACKPDIDISNKPIVLMKESMLEYEKGIYVRFISEIFKTRSGLQFETIQKELSAHGKIHPTILKMALRTMVREQILFKDKTHRFGYLLFRSDRYWFQPRDISDRKLLNRERLMNQTQCIKGIPIHKIKIEQNKEVEEEHQTIDINDQVLIDTYNSIENLVKGQISEQRDDPIIWDMISDTLPFEYIKTIAAQSLSDTLTPEGIKLVKALHRGYIFWPGKPGPFVYQYDKDIFLIPEKKPVIWNECAPSNKKKFSDVLVTDLKVRIPANENGEHIVSEINGLMDIDKGESVFKIIEKNMLPSLSSIKKGRIGSICLQTSGFKIEGMIELIMSEVKKQGITEYPSLFSENHKKKALCKIYEYWLRRGDKISQTVRFLRPAQFKTYKEKLI